MIKKRQGLNMAKKRILVVEDEVELANTIKDWLETNRYTVITALDGEEALAKARNEKPDLVLLDIMLPKISGFDVCRKLKIDDRYKHLPIIVITAKFQPNDIRFGEEMGADAYLTKPVEFKILLGKIRELLARDYAAKPREKTSP